MGAMYPDYWDEYDERSGPCECCPGNKPKNVQVYNTQHLVSVPTPTYCYICDKSLEGQTKSFRACDGCYLEANQQKSVDT